NQKQSLRAFFVAHDRSRLKLRQQIHGARERPGNDRREKSDEGQVIKESSRGFDRAAIDIDYVTERAKGDEWKTERQHQTFEHRKGTVPANLLQQVSQR